MFESLDDIRTDCANRLIRAAHDRKSPMHTPVIVTADVDARVMVLRAFDAARWMLRLHTDTRAPKAQAIAEFEHRYLTRLIERTGGNVSAAARLACKERRSLGKLLKKHGIQRDAD